MIDFHVQGKMQRKMAQALLQNKHDEYFHLNFNQSRLSNKIIYLAFKWFMQFEPVVNKM